MRPLNEEEIRVLRAAARARVVKNANHWQIVHGEPPDKRAREHLLRSGLIETPVLNGSRRTKLLCATERGKTLLRVIDETAFAQAWLSNDVPF